MQVEELQRRLQAGGYWVRGAELEYFELLEEFGPEGALQDVTCYRLIARRGGHRFDMATRDWKPVLVIGEDVWVDASPAMFTALIQASGYFNQPGAFAQILVFQLHRFALDFYQGYQVREEALQFDDETLTITGQAYRGAGHDVSAVAFATTVSPAQETRFQVASAGGRQLKPG